MEYAAIHLTVRTSRSEPVDCYQSIETWSAPMRSVLRSTCVRLDRVIATSRPSLRVRAIYRDHLCCSRLYSTARLIGPMKSTKRSGRTVRRKERQLDGVKVIPRPASTC